MENINCLENMACPKCGQADKLYILACLWLEVTDDGTDSMARGLPDYETEWTDDSKCICPKCGHWGRVHRFQTTG